MGEEGAVLGEEVAFGKGATGGVIKKVTDVEGMNKMNKLNTLNETKEAVVALEDPECFQRHQTALNDRESGMTRRDAPFHPNPKYPECRSFQGRLIVLDHHRASLPVETPFQFEVEISEIQIVLRGFR